MGELEAPPGSGQHSPQSVGPERGDAADESDLRDAPRQAQRTGQREGSAPRDAHHGELTPTELVGKHLNVGGSVEELAIWLGGGMTVAGSIHRDEVDIQAGRQHRIGWAKQS
jgi:hypothetical protein